MGRVVNPAQPQPDRLRLGRRLRQLEILPVPDQAPVKRKALLIQRDAVRSQCLPARHIRRRREPAVADADAVLVQPRLPRVGKVQQHLSLGRNLAGGGITRAVGAAIVNPGVSPHVAGIGRASALPVVAVGRIPRGGFCQLAIVQRFARAEPAVKRRKPEGGDLDPLRIRRLPLGRLNGLLQAGVQGLHPVRRKDPVHGPAVPRIGTRGFVGLLENPVVGFHGLGRGPVKQGVKLIERRTRIGVHIPGHAPVCPAGRNAVLPVILHGLDRTVADAQVI